MPISKTLTLLNPIKKSFSVRDPVKASTQSKRTVSLKPSISKACSAAVDLLPPIKITLEPLRSGKSVPRERNKPLRNGFDERILSSKEKHMVVRTQGVYKGLEGMSKQALVQRKESHLNTYFNQRKSRLKQITKENKQIYVKINSQKSLYSSRELNRSSSNASLSRRLSQSKLSRSDSERSIAGKTPRKRQGKREVQKEKEVHIESHSIQTVQGNQVNSYLSIFCNHLNVRNKAEKKIGSHPLVFNPPDRPERDKQNRILAPQGKLQRIIEEFNQRSKRKANIVLARLL